MKKECLSGNDWTSNAGRSTGKGETFLRRTSVSASKGACSKKSTRSLNEGDLRGAGSFERRWPSICEHMDTRALVEWVNRRYSGLAQRILGSRFRRLTEEEIGGCWNHSLYMLWDERYEFFGPSQMLSIAWKRCIWLASGRDSWLRFADLGDEDTTHIEALFADVATRHDVADLGDGSGEAVLVEESVLDRVSERQRTCVRLVTVVGWSYAEVGELLDLQPHQVEAACVNGRARARRYARTERVL